MRASSLRSRAWVLALLATTLLAGCSDDPADNLIAAIVGGVVGLLLLATWGCGLYTACIVASGISIHHNRTKPTVRSKRWGWVFGVLNLINGGGMGALLTNMRTEANTEIDVLLYGAAYSTAAVVAGVVGIVFAVRAQPE